MLATTTVDESLVKVCITINATVLAGIVCADVDAGGAAAGGPLVFVLFHRKTVLADTPKAFGVYAVGVADAILA
mgnify:CR=1 FL=1